MKKKKRSYKKTPGEATLVPIKIQPRAIREIRANAKKYADGNLSAWMRHAAIRYKPKRGEVVDLSTTPSLKKKKS